MVKDQGILIFSSVFDLDSLEFLEKINNPIYKISSFEITDLNLIKNVAKKIMTGIPKEIRISRKDIDILF